MKWWHSRPLVERLLGSSVRTSSRTSHFGYSASVLCKHFSLHIVLIAGADVARLARNHPVNLRERGGGERGLTQY